MAVPRSDRLGADRSTSDAGNAGSGREAGGTCKGLGSEPLIVIDTGSPRVAPVGDAGVSWAPVPDGGAGAAPVARGASRSDRLGFSWRTAASGARLGTARDTFALGLVRDAGAFRAPMLVEAVRVARPGWTASGSDWRGLSCGRSAPGAATIPAPGLACTMEGFTAGAAGGEASFGATSSGLLASRGGGDGSGGPGGRGTSIGLAGGTVGRGLSGRGRGRSRNAGLAEAGALGVASGPADV